MQFRLRQLLLPLLVALEIVHRLRESHDRPVAEQVRMETQEKHMEGSRRGVTKSGVQPRMTQRKQETSRNVHPEALETVSLFNGMTARQPDDGRHEQQSDGGVGQGESQSAAPGNSLAAIEEIEKRLGHKQEGQDRPSHDEPHPASPTGSLETPLHLGFPCQTRLSSIA